MTPYRYYAYMDIHTVATENVKNNCMLHSLIYAMPATVLAWLVMCRSMIPGVDHVPIPSLGHIIS